MLSKVMHRLKLPETKNISDLDHPSTTLLHREIIRSKPFLKNLYLDFYAEFQKAVPELSSQYCVELGSGGGFLKEVFPSVITSDVLEVDCVDKHFSGLEMPFENSSVDAFFMVDVFHHIPDAKRFLSELTRCLKAGGKVVMIEPANTLWGRFIYQNFHHEAFEPGAGWTLAKEGPLSSANGALPWIVFQRDKKQFEADFPQLTVSRFQEHTPLRYLLSGGVSMRQLMPSGSYGFWKGFESLLAPLSPWLGMFVTIELQKN